MANGTINLNKSSSSGKYIVGKIEWSSTTNSADNKSSVTCSLWVKKGDPSQTLTVPTEGTWSYSLEINGSKVTGTVYESVLEAWVKVYEKTVTGISHNSDGSKSITISGSVTAPSATSFAGHTTSGSGTVTFETISRASTLTSAADVTLGNKCSVKWTPMSSSLWYRLEFWTDDDTWSYRTDVISPNTTSAYTYTGYTIPLEVANYYPDATQGQMWVGLFTYSDSSGTQQVGEENWLPFTVTIPNNSSTKPEVHMTLAPVSSLGSAFSGLYIQGKTKVKATLSATSPNGAGISEYSMKVEDTTYGAADEYTSGFLSKYGTTTVFGYATDNRGIPGETSESIYVIAYSKPKIQDVVVTRCDKNGEANEKGEYIKIYAKRSYSPVMVDNEQKNFCEIRFRYKATSASAYSDWYTILQANFTRYDDVQTSALLGGVLNPESSYVIQVQAIDDIGDSAETTVGVQTEGAYWHRTKNGMGFGGYCEGENLMDVHWDARFRGDVLIGSEGMTLRDYILSVISEGG